MVSASVANAGTGYVQATTTITAVGTFAHGAAPTLLPIVGGALNIYRRHAGRQWRRLWRGADRHDPAAPAGAVNANGVGGIRRSGDRGDRQRHGVLGVDHQPGRRLPDRSDRGDRARRRSIRTSRPASPMPRWRSRWPRPALIMGALVTNNGSPLNNGSLASSRCRSAAPELPASLTANVMQTVVSGKRDQRGFRRHGVSDTTSGGGPLQGSITNGPELVVPGIFAAPCQYRPGIGHRELPRSRFTMAGCSSRLRRAVVVPGVGATSTIATVAFIMGSRSDIAVIQPAP